MRRNLISQPTVDTPYACPVPQFADMGTRFADRKSGFGYVKYNIPFRNCLSMTCGGAASSLGRLFPGGDQAVKAKGSSAISEIVSSGAAGPRGYRAALEREHGSASASTTSRLCSTIRIEA